MIYIAFVNGTSLLSRIIRFFAPGPSHVCLVWKSCKLGVVQLGSEANGWVLLPGDSLLADLRTELYAFPGTNLWPGLAKNREYLGTPYDFGGLLGMTWVMATWRLFRHRFNNPFQSPQAWFCSEIVAKVLIDSGVKLRLAPGETDPGRLLEEIKSCGAVKISSKGLL